MLTRLAHVVKPLCVCGQFTYLKVCGDSLDATGASPSAKAANNLILLGWHSWWSGDQSQESDFSESRKKWCLHTCLWPARAGMLPTTIMFFLFPKSSYWVLGLTETSLVHATPGVEMPSGGCPSKRLYCCIETPRANSISKRKQFVWLPLPPCCPSPREARTGTQTGQEPEGRSWWKSRGGVLLANLLPIICSTCFLIEPRTSNPGTVPHTMACPLSYQSLRKCPMCWPTVWFYGRDFLIWSSILSNDFSLCQTDINYPMQTRLHFHSYFLLG